MSDLDRRLERLGVLPTDPRLAGLTPQVIAGAVRLRARRGVQRQITLAAGAALVIGVAGGLAPLEPGRAAPAADELTGVPSLAPSSLLAG